MSNTVPSEYYWLTRNVSTLTYKVIVAVRYPELVLQDANHTHIGHFVPHEATVAQGGFRTVLWNAPKDLRAAVEDVVSFCNYLKNCYQSLRQGATSQLLVLCNRTAVQNLLLQHGFQATWCAEGIYHIIRRGSYCAHRCYCPNSVGFSVVADEVQLLMKGRIATDGPQ